MIGAVLFVCGCIMGFDIFGLGTKWRTVGMRYYDQGGDQGTYERNARRFRITHRAIAAVGLLFLLAGVVTLL
jgi:hypothetical protein